jgi:hypothetical protein
MNRMKCAIHEDREAIGACCSCGRYVCSECKVSIGGQVYCNQCLDARIRTGAWPAQTRIVTPCPSGAGAGSPVPLEIRGWSWGGFLLTWIWGIGNNVWIAFVALASIIPYVGWVASLTMSIILGIRGNEWAWQNKRWESVEQFKQTQRRWMWWGVTSLVANIVLALAVAVLLVSLIMIFRTLGLGGDLNNVLPWGL